MPCTRAPPDACPDVVDACGEGGGGAVAGAAVEKAETASTTAVTAALPRMNPRYAGQGRQHGPEHPGEALRHRRPLRDDLPRNPQRHRGRGGTARDPLAEHRPRPAG